MKLNKKTIIGIVLALAVVIAVWYFFIRKSDPLAGASNPMGGSGGSGVPGDDAAYNQLINYLKANIDPMAMDNWLGDIAKTNYTTGNVNPDYLINGQITKTGALLSAWATAYQPYPNYTFKIDRNTMNGEAYRIFYQLKGQNNRL